MVRVYAWIQKIWGVAITRTKYEIVFSLKEYKERPINAF